MKANLLALTLALLAASALTSAAPHKKLPERRAPQARQRQSRATICRRPQQKFEGKIERNAAQSIPWWPARVVPAKGAPNILLIMTDETGFGVTSTFGGVVPTPTLDQIAANGLRYTNFNSTALCSPTRAAIITGRNHHSMGFGVVAEQATGFPGYDSFMTRDKATIGKIL